MFGNEKVDEPVGSKRYKGAEGMEGGCNEIRKKDGHKERYEGGERKSLEWRQRGKNREKTDRSTKRLNQNDA